MLNANSLKMIQNVREKSQKKKCPGEKHFFYFETNQKRLEKIVQGCHFFRILWSFFVWNIAIAAFLDAKSLMNRATRGLLVLKRLERAVTWMVTWKTVILVNTINLGVRVDLLKCWLLLMIMNCSNSTGLMKVMLIDGRVEGRLCNRAENSEKKQLIKD